jgi:sugar transferase (PEP-CTERM/EpsH1 system associated)
MRILMLAHRIPYPPHTGDKTRAFHIARHLARRHDLTLAFPVDDWADLGGLSALQDLGASLEYSRLWRPWSLLKGLGRLALGGSVSLGYFGSRALERRVKRRGVEGPYDLVYVSSTPMAQYARDFGVPVVMDFVDVDSDKWRQYAEHSRAPQSWLYRTEGRRLQAVEGDIARWAGLSVLATTAEETLLRSFAPWARTAVIPNGIALDYYQPVEQVPGPPAVIFTGAMDYMPNVDAVQHFCGEILPRIRERIPDTRFYIVGLKPAAEVRRLAETRGVVVTGTVPDVRPYYGRVGVCVAPLRIGRGVQNKVLQSMAMGIPVVASSVAQRGLEAVPGKHLYVEDDPLAVAERVVSLLEAPVAGKFMGRQARAFVESHHSWDASCSRLEAMLLALAKSNPRLAGSPA